MKKPQTLFEYYRIQDAPAPYEMSERAAIKEFDANMTQAQAESEVSDEWQATLDAEIACTRTERQINQEEKYKMIKVQRNNTPSGSTTPKGVQFLSPKHVTSPDGFTVRIYKVTTDQPDNYGNPYVIYLENKGGEKFSKGFKATSDLLISLVDQLGDDESKWIGQEIIVNKRVDDEGGSRLTFTKLAVVKARK